MDKIKVSVIVPILNEEDNVELLSDKLVHILGNYSSYEIIFIDDGSNDNTLENIAIEILDADNRDTLCGPVAGLEGESVVEPCQILELLHLPMLRHLAQPLDAGVLQGYVGVEAAGDSAVDDGLLLLRE